MQVLELSEQRRLVPQPPHVQLLQAVVVVDGARDGLEEHHGVGPALRVRRVGVGKGKRRAVFVVGLPAGDEPADEAGEHERDLVGQDVEVHVASIARDGVLRAAICQLEVLGVGLGDGAVREDEVDAVVGHRDVDGDEIDHGGGLLAGRGRWLFVGRRAGFQVGRVSVDPVEMTEWLAGV